MGNSIAVSAIRMMIIDDRPVCVRHRRVRWVHEAGGKVWWTP